MHIGVTEWAYCQRQVAFLAVITGPTVAAGEERP